MPINLGILYGNAMHALSATISLFLFKILHFFLIIIFYTLCVNNISWEFIMTKLTRTAIVMPTLMIFSIMMLWLPAANAAFLGTAQAEAETVTRSADQGAIENFLAQEAVQQQLVQLGVNPEQALTRAASLSQAERLMLQDRINDLPAGAGAVEVIGIVFIVLIILELLGVTDIFKKI